MKNLSRHTTTCAALLPGLLLLAASAPVSQGADASAHPFAVPAARGNHAACARAGAPFDWIVPAGSSVAIDTVLGTIQGGDGSIQGTMTVTGGLIDVRDVEIGPGARVVFQGPNPVTIVASGQVYILGEIDVSGTDARGRRIPPFPYRYHDQPGPRGRAGGGRGGTGSPSLTSSSARGGSGEGAFGRPNAGGQGGETSYHPSSVVERRGAGGGGGRFGPDIRYAYQGQDVLCQTLQGMDAEPGFPGGWQGTGAVSQTSRARGGRRGLTPFRDTSPRNDFFGVALTPNGLLVGELERPWAGSGGGAGGDAIRADAFPNPNPPPAPEEAGAPGGAGGGSLTILAAGDIHVGPAGRLCADGGNGTGGENTNFLDRIGGGGGGGSGGHLILQSLGKIRIEAIAAGAGVDYADSTLPGAEHPPRPLSARGGQGGVGRDNRGGAHGPGPHTPAVQSTWKCDAIPLERLEVAGLSVPPRDEACFLNLAIGTDPDGSVPGAGGDGGPGVIQLHVPNPATDIIVADAAGGDLTRVCLPRPFGWRDGVFEMHLLPQIAPVARLQSHWVRLGAPPSDEAAVRPPREPAPLPPGLAVPTRF